MKQARGEIRQISLISSGTRLCQAFGIACIIFALCATVYAAQDDKVQPSPGSFESVKQLAEKGNAEAQLKLAQMYQEGKGVAQNLQEAFKWCHKAADQGLAQAQFMLGRMYETGKGVAKDGKEAMNWIQKAADKGLEAAKEEIRNLGTSPAAVDEEIDKVIKMIR